MNKNWHKQYILWKQQLVDLIGEDSDWKIRSGLFRRTEYLILNHDGVIVRHATYQEKELMRLIYDYELWHN